MASASKKKVTIIDRVYRVKGRLTDVGDVLPRVALAADVRLNAIFSRLQLTIADVNSRRVLCTPEILCRSSA